MPIYLYEKSSIEFAIILNKILQKVVSVTIDLLVRDFFNAIMSDRLSLSEVQVNETGWARSQEFMAAVQAQLIWAIMSKIVPYIERV